jgi:hypothetical protein
MCNELLSFSPKLDRVIDFHACANIASLIPARQPFRFVLVVSIRDIREIRGYSRPDRIGVNHGLPGCHGYFECMCQGTA